MEFGNRGDHIFGNNYHVFANPSAGFLKKVLVKASLCAFIVAGLLTLAVFPDYSRSPQPYLSAIWLTMGGVFLTCYAVLCCKANKGKHAYIMSVASPSRRVFSSLTRNGRLPQSSMRKHVTVTFNARQEYTSSNAQVLYADEPPTYVSVCNTCGKIDAESAGAPPNYKMQINKGNKE